MTELTIAVIGITSAIAYLLGVRVLGLPAGGMARAVGATFEVVGLGVLFLAINTTMAAAVVWGSRAMGTPMSLYLAIEKIWIVMSLLQALVVHAWWRGAGRLDSAAKSGVDEVMRAER